MLITGGGAVRGVPFRQGIGVDKFLDERHGVLEVGVVPEAGSAYNFQPFPLNRIM